MSSFPPCNAVLVTEFYRAKTINLPDSVLVASGSAKRGGSYQTVQPSKFDSRITITNLPMPIGRVTNYTLQKRVIAKADLFIFVVATSDFRKLNILDCPKNVPSVCWINNSYEAERIERWKADEKARLLNLSRLASKFLDKKLKPSVEPRYFPMYRLEWYTRPEKFPVKSLQKVKETIQRICGDQIEFFTCSSTSIQDLLVSGGKVSEEFTKEWKKLVEKAVKLHEERRGDQPPPDDKTQFPWDDTENGLSLITVY